MFGMGTGGTSLPSSPLWLYPPTHAFPRARHIYLLINLPKKINNYIANLTKSIFLFLEARKNYRILFVKSSYQSLYSLLLS